jgi:hypothetical protein
MRVLVRLADGTYREVADGLSDQEAQEERNRIERVVNEAGGDRLISSHRASFIASHVVGVEVAEEVAGASGYFGDDEPEITRDMKF